MCINEWHFALTHICSETEWRQLLQSCNYLECRLIIVELQLIQVIKSNSYSSLCAILTTCEKTDIKHIYFNWIDKKVLCKKAELFWLNQQLSRPFRPINIFTKPDFYGNKLAAVIIKISVNEWSLCVTVLSCYSVWFYWVWLCFYVRLQYVIFTGVSAAV